MQNVRMIIIKRMEAENEGEERGAEKRGRRGEGKRESLYQWNNSD